MATCRVLGIDPGSAHVGWAVIDIDGSLVTWVRGGKFDAPDLTHGWFMHEVLDCDLVAVERPVPRAAFALRQLVETAIMAGRLHGWADALEGVAYAYSEATSFEWRKAICGDHNAKDAQVRFAIEGQVANLPRTNSHVRDAAGVAIYLGKNRALPIACRNLGDVKQVFGEHSPVAQALEAQHGVGGHYRPTPAESLAVAGLDEDAPGVVRG